MSTEFLKTCVCLEKDIIHYYHLFSLFLKTWKKSSFKKTFF